MEFREKIEIGGLEIRVPNLGLRFWDVIEPDPSEIDLLCQENFDEGKSILPLMHKLPILSTTT
jgi:hypothetical protein